MYEYRVLKRDGEFAVHEVFYNASGEPTSCTENMLSPAAPSLEDLKHELELILGALAKPTIDYSSFEKE